MSKIDVIVPYFEGEVFIADALASLAAQTGHHDLRVVVIDDASTKESNALLRAALERAPLECELIVHDRNLGIGLARQRGLDHVTAEVVGFLDQDDRWQPNLLDDLLGLLGGAEYAAGRIEMTLAPGCARPAWCRPEWLSGSLPGTVVGAGLFRTEMLRRLGGFNTALRNGGDDVDLFGRLRRAKVVTSTVNEVVLTRLVHDHNASGRPALDGDLLTSVRGHLGAH